MFKALLGMAKTFLVSALVLNWPSSSFGGGQGGDRSDRDEYRQCCWILHLDPKRRCLRQKADDGDPSQFYAFFLLLLRCRVANPTERKNAPSSVKKCPKCVFTT